MGTWQHRWENVALTCLSLLREPFLTHPWQFLAFFALPENIRPSSDRRRFLTSFHSNLWRFREHAVLRLILMPWCDFEWVNLRSIRQHWTATLHRGRWSKIYISSRLKFVPRPFLYNFEMTRDCEMHEKERKKEKKRKEGKIKEKSSKKNIKYRCFAGKQTTIKCYRIPPFPGLSLEFWFVLILVCVSRTSTDTRRSQ